MKALVIGANGFAGKYMCRELEQNSYSVVKADLLGKDGIVVLDIMDYQAVLSIIRQELPDAIFNLAGFSSVSQSYKQPQLAVNLNVIASINILEAVRATSDKIKVLLIGSSDQYGKSVDNDLCFDEDAVQNPISPYAISKRCQEDIGKSYASIYGMNIFMTRSFNHIGVGQRLGFVVSDFANGIANIERGEASVLRVGNTSTYRSFTDVRDIVYAYRLIIEKGVPGRVYNVGSEKKYSIQNILDILIGLADCSIKVEQDPAKMRVFDSPCASCDNSLLCKDTGWFPRYSIEETLNEILNSFRQNEVCNE